MIARRPAGVQLGSGLIRNSCADRCWTGCSGCAGGAQVRWRALRPANRSGAVFPFSSSEVCMILRWSLMTAALLAAGVASAQNTGGGTSGSATSSAASSAAQQAPQTPPAPITAADKPNLSYAIGYQIGEDF